MDECIWGSYLAILATVVILVIIAIVQALQHEPLDCSRLKNWASRVGRQHDQGESEC